VTCILGIDPGVSGGIACFSDEMRAWKMPDTERDVWKIIESIRDEHAPDVMAYIEAVHSSPQMGVASAFTFGRGYGFLRGCLIAAEIPFEQVTPQRWQKAMACLTRGDKNVSKARAQQLFPRLKVNHAIADSVLICEYARRLRAGELSDSARSNGALFKG
jgi:Holliday junction resolvasome RuvABC endonuclease subunit